MNQTGTSPHAPGCAPARSRPTLDTAVDHATRGAWFQRVLVGLVKVVEVRLERHHAENTSRVRFDGRHRSARLPAHHAGACGTSRLINTESPCSALAQLWFARSDLKHELIRTMPHRSRLRSAAS